MTDHTIELLGGVAGILTTASFLPQVYKVLHERQTSAISLWTYIVYLLGIALWIVYGFLLHSFSMISANCVTFVLASSILGMKLYYERGGEPLAPLTSPMAMPLSLPEE
jgi:MtN3 and saliva related transmembrane protein